MGQFTLTSVSLTGIAGFTTTDAMLLAERNHALAPVDLLAAPGAGAWDGAANLTSAVIAGGLFQLDHNDTATDDWWGATFTSPFYRFLVDRQPGLPLIVESHTACPQGDLAANWHSGLVMLAAVDTNATFVRAGLAYGDNRQYGASYNAAFGFGAAIINLTSAQWATGYWTLIIVRPDHGVEILRVAGPAGTPPTLADYQTHGVVAGIFDGSDTRLRVGFTNTRAGAAPVGIQFNFGALRIRGGQLVRVAA